MLTGRNINKLYEMDLIYYTLATDKNLRSESGSYLRTRLLPHPQMNSQIMNIYVYLTVKIPQIVSRALFYFHMI